MNKKKYLFLITGMVMGGAERVMATIANEFVSRGHDVTIITMREPISAYRLDYRVKIFGAGGTLDAQSSLKRNWQLAVSGIKGFRFYLKHLMRLQPDVVLSFLTRTNLLAVVICKLIVRHIPVVISERNDPLIGGKFTRKMCAWLYPKADRVVCQSKKVGSYFISVNRKTKIEVIPNPVNIECIAHNMPVVKRKVIVAVGRLSKQKNYPLLIESFDRIKEKFPEHCVEIYGQGPEEEHLKRLISSLGLDDKVFLMGTRKNVMQEVNNSTLYVMASSYEGFPNALIEAMASALPVISTDFETGVAQDLIQNGVNGFLVPVNDIDAMANAMIEILKDSDLQYRMSENNRKIINILDQSRIINRWEDVLNSTISTHREKN